MNQGMSPLAKRTSAQLKEIIQDDNKSKQGAMVFQEQQDGKEVWDPVNSCLELNILLNAINNKFENDTLDEAVRLLTAHPICQLKQH